MKMYVKSAKELEVYKLAYKQAMEIFEISKQFPKEEKYSLTIRFADHLVRYAKICVKPGQNANILLFSQAN